MKRFTLSVLSVAMAVAAWAHRDVYFTWSFDKTENFGHASWSFDGADHMEGTAESILTANGFCEHDGQPTIKIEHDSRAHGERLMPNLNQIHLSVVCGGAEMGPHVTPVVEIEDEYGEKVYFDFAPLEDNLELTQTVQSTGYRGDLSNLEKINYFRIYFDGIQEGEMLAPYTIAFCSDWIFPVVCGSNVAKTTDFGADASGLVSTELGVTYIQAEDFNEKWINGKVAHSQISGTNGYRLNPEDQNLRIGQSDDGSNFARWDENHGRILASHVVTAAPHGQVIWDFCPSGADWQKYYGEYADANGGITLENAFKNWGAWTEYTFDVTGDCTLEISLRVGAHRDTFCPQIANGSPYWYEAPEDAGYYLADYPDDEFFAKFGHKYMLSFDDQIVRTNRAKAPVYDGGDSQVFVHDILPNPEKWSDVTETVNGETVNSVYLQVTPNPFWSWEVVNKDGVNMDGKGWDPHYVSDIVKESLNRGLISEAVANTVNEADYVIPVKKGRHTIKVQNCGGINMFDEIRIKVQDPAGIEEVVVGGAEDAFEGTPVYYDLQGRVVNNPSNGVFIRKSGSKVEKIVL